MARTIPLDARLEARLEEWRLAGRARQRAAARVTEAHAAGRSSEDAFRDFLRAEREEDHAAQRVAIALDHRIELGEQKGAA